MIPYYENRAQEFVDRTISIDMIALYKPFLVVLPVTVSTAHLLDAACGSGRDTRYFLSQGFKVTAFDSSPALVELAEDITGQPVLEMTFMDMAWNEEFDGIWSSACLLHCLRSEIEPVMDRFIRALKPNGIWYLSFKEGGGESIDPETNRVFNSYTVESLGELISRFPAIVPINIWSQSSSDTDETNWVNALVRKRGVSE